MTDDPSTPPDDEDDGTAPAEQPTDDAASTTTAKQRQTRIVVEREQVRKFWSEAMRHPVGQRVLWQLLADLHTFEERFACGPNGFPQPEATWFHAGEQAVGLRLYRSLAIYDRDALFAMQDKYDPAFAKPKLSRKRRVP